MKPSIVLLTSFAFASLAASATTFDKLVTTGGDEYYKVKVTKVTASSIVILHKKGVSQIPFEKLPEEIREQYGYSLERSLAEKKQIDSERTARNKDRQLAEQQRAANSQVKWVTTNQYTPEFKAHLDKELARAGGRIGGHGIRAGGVYESGPYKNMTEAELVEKVKGRYSGQIYVKHKVSGEAASDSSRISEIQAIQKEIEAIDKQLESGTTATGTTTDHFGFSTGTVRIKMSQEERARLESRRATLQARLSRLLQ